MSAPIHEHVEGQINVPTDDPNADTEWYIRR